jgi:hypothetical protein
MCEIMNNVGNNTWMTAIILFTGKKMKYFRLNVLHVREKHIFNKS